MRFIKFSLYSGCFLLIIFFYTMLFTATGVSILVNSLGILMEAEVSAKHIRGSLYRGVEIEELFYEVSDESLSAESVSFRWQVFDLLKARIHFSHLSAKNIRIVVADRVGDAASATENIWLPPLSLESVKLDNIDLLSPDEVQLFHLDTIQFALGEDDKKYTLQELLIRNNRFTVHANGSIEFVEPFNTRVISQIVVKQDDKPSVRADIRMNGNRRSLNADLDFHDKLQGRATISIKNLLDKPTWHAELKLHEVNPRTFDSSLPDLLADIVLFLEGDSSALKGEGQANTAHKMEKKDGTVESRNIDSQLAFAINFANGDIFVELEKGQLVTNEGEFGVTGNYRHSSRQMELDANWDHLLLQLPESSYLFNTRGSLSIGGGLDSYIFKTDIEVSGMRNIPPFRIVAPGTGNRDSLFVHEAELSLLDGKLICDVQASWKDQQEIQISWKGEKIDPAIQWQQWPGELTTSGELQLVSSDDAWKWEIKKSTTKGRLRGAPLSLSLSGKSSTSGAAQVSATAAYAQASAVIKGQVGKNLDLKWQVESTDLSQVHPHMQGSLESHGELSGSSDKPAINAKIIAVDIRSPWGSSADLRADVNLDLSSDALMKADISMDQLNVEDLDIDHLQLKLDGRNSHHQFSLKADSAGKELELDGEGRLQETSWSGRIKSMLLQHQVYKKWEASKEFSLHYDKGSMRVQSFCLKQTATSICADGHYQKTNGMWELQTVAELIPLSHWQSKLPETIVLDGHMDLNMLLKGEGRKPVSGSGRINIPSGAVDVTVSDEADNQLILDQSYLEFELDNGKLQARGEVPNPGHSFKPLQTRFQVTGLSTGIPSPESLSIDGALQSGVTDLSLLSSIFPQLLEVRGRADLNVLVSGTMAEPVYDGSITLVEGAFSSSDVGIEVKNINFEGKKVSKDRYEVEGALYSGKGHLKVKAVAGQLDRKGPEFNVTLEGDNFELVNLPELWALVRPTMTGKISLVKQSYEGKIFIPNASINLDEIGFASTVSEDEIVNNAEPEDRAGRLLRQLKVNVELGDAVHIKGKGISGRLVGKLDILNNKQGLLIGDGEIAISNGVFTAYGQNLLIQEGRLIYNKSALDNPAMRVVATRNVDDFKVGLKIDGYTTSPQISLFSTVSLPQEQILSYIVFGRSLNSLSSREGSDLLGAATSMGLQNSGFITDKVAARFGLDQISLSGSTAQSASLVIGKYLNPKLYLSYGLGIFDKISTARLKYDLSRRFSLEAERGSETGIDLFYKIDK